MGLLSRLFGGGKDAPAAQREAVEHNGFLIYPEPLRQGGQFLTAGTIAKDYPDGRKEHRFIRADSHPAYDDAVTFTVSKARQIIDQVGERMFD